MIKDQRNINQLKLKKGATGKLLTTADQKFSIIIFTERQEILGKGAFGKCYIGILESSQSSDNDNKHEENSDIRKHPIVVVKEIKKDIRKPKQQEMYKRQIQNLSLATKIPSTSKNLVKCYPFILSSQLNYYMVMQYCEGKSLDKLMNKRTQNGKWFNFLEFLKILSDIVSGYYPLNKLMIMHQDLKPQNIFIKGKQFKIGDFGLSFLMKGKEQCTRGGSLSYNGKQKYSRSAGPASHKSDMYAIGVILFRLFYGMHPYFERSNWQLYRYCEVNRLMQLGNLKNPKLKLSRWDELEMFLKFYETRKVKQIESFIKPPQLNQELKTYQKRLINLYEQKIPELINKLIQKQINDRPSFTQVDLFLKQNKVNQILKYIQEIKNSGQTQIQFFDDLNLQGSNKIKLPKSFDKIKDQICMEPGSQIQKRDLQLQMEMLRTAGNNRQKKAFLMRKFPKVFQLKEKIQKINSITRFLMNVYEELNELDLIKLSSSMRPNKNEIEDENETFVGQDQFDQNQILFYQDKKIEVEFVVQKYLYSFLLLVKKQIETQIKQFKQDELQIFYQENVDFLLQLIQKNKQYLESELFIAHDDHINFQNCQKQLETIILQQFFKFFTLDQNNLVLVYECICILKIKDFILQIKNELVHGKQKRNNNQEYQQPSKSPQQIFIDQWINFSKILKNLNLRNNQDQQNENLDTLKSFVIKELQGNNIKFLINLD